MPLWTPRTPAYLASFCSVGATRIAASYGTTVTPAQNSKGSYAQVLTSGNVSFDVFAIQININSNAVSAAARDTIIDIGVDPAGGTSYSVLIPDLLASCASSYIGALGSGINYWFPVWIKSGSTVAARASVNNATVGTCKVWMRIWGKPSDHRQVRVGTKVKSYGITAGSSTGTSVTAGTTSEGSWTSLGTIAAGDDPWFWQYGMGVNNGTVTAVGYAADLGIGAASNKQLVVEQRVWQGTTGEAWYDSGPSVFGYYQAKAADIVYGRVQASGTAVSGINMAAWGVI